MKATIKCLSICPCGFPVLNPSIGLGTEYEIDPNRWEKFTLICGGCDHTMSVTGIWVENRGDSKGGYLPEAIFHDPAKPIIALPKTHMTADEFIGLLQIATLSESEEERKGARERLEAMKKELKVNQETYGCTPEANN